MKRLSIKQWSIFRRHRSEPFGKICCLRNLERNKCDFWTTIMISHLRLQRRLSIHSHKITRLTFVLPSDMVLFWSYNSCFLIAGLWYFSLSRDPPACLDEGKPRRRPPGRWVPMITEIRHATAAKASIMCLSPSTPHRKSRLQYSLWLCLFPVQGVSSRSKILSCMGLFYSLLVNHGRRRNGGSRQSLTLSH